MNEREIFEMALEIGKPEARLRYVERVCAGDLHLRARIEGLLSSRGIDGSFLANPIGGLGHPAPDSSGETCLVELPFAPGGDGDEVLSHPPDLSFLRRTRRPDSLGLLEHYEVLEILGQGSFGVVFKAFDEKLQRPVAIKVINPRQAADSLSRQRFLREARAVAAVTHENVVRVYRVEPQPVPFLVMELIEGQTLQQRLNRSGPFEVPELVQIACQLASGLAAAHALGLIHRDIKPANVLIENAAELTVKITDFGLARAVDEESLTQTGAIAGTPLYMSPEQALGSRLDVRSDLFSLGCVLYAMASGRPPFQGPDSATVLRKVLNETPRPLRACLPDIPEWLELLVDKLLAKDPADRLQTAARVLQILESRRMPSGSVSSAEFPALPGPARDADSGDSSDAERGELVPRVQADKEPADSLHRVATTREMGRSRELLRRRGGVFALCGVAALSILWVIYAGLTAQRAASPRAPPSRRAESRSDAKRSTVEARPDPAGVVWHGWPADAPLPARVPFDGEQARKHQRAWADYLGVPVEYVNSLGMKFRLIPPGEFLMGTSSADLLGVRELATARDDHIALNALPDETPQVRVVLTRPFYLGVFEVTQAQYQTTATSSPSYFSSTGRGRLLVRGRATQDHPVEMVSWSDAVEFCRKLTQQDGLVDDSPTGTGARRGSDVSGYRLPTEAEWEFACRAGTTTQYTTGDRDTDLLEAGWFRVNSPEHTQPAGALRPNHFGLYDMHGNVWEWVRNDWVDGENSQRDEDAVSINPTGPLRNSNIHVIRGGAWNDTAERCRSAFRYRSGARVQNLGFRVALTVDAVRKALGQPPVPYPKADVVDPNRDVAERVLARFGPRYVRLRDDRLVVRSNADLPGGSLVVEEISLGGGPVEASLFNEFSRLSSLKRLSVNHTDVNDAGLEVLGNLASLTDLSLVGCQAVTAEGVRRLESRLPKCRVRSDFHRASGETWFGWPAEAPEPAIAPFDSAQAPRFQEAWARYLNVPVEFTNSLGMKFRLIPPGSFLRGSSDKQIEEFVGQVRDYIEASSERIDGVRSEAPSHSVILTVPFYLAVLETTQAAFRRVTDRNPAYYSPAGGGKGFVIQNGLDADSLPVDEVSWRDASEFCRLLGEQEAQHSAPQGSGSEAGICVGAGYRLPSEAEWEFACRAGTQSRYWTGDDLEGLKAAAWLRWNSETRSHEVGTRAANPFGLYDVHGNVWEWTDDGWDFWDYSTFEAFGAINPRTETSSVFRVLKGGNNFDTEVFCRSASRFPQTQDSTHLLFGFRVAVSVEAVRRAAGLAGPPFPSTGEVLHP